MLDSLKKVRPVGENENLSQDEKEKLINNGLAQVQNGELALTNEGLDKLQTEVTELKRENTEEFDPSTLPKMPYSDITGFQRDALFSIAHLEVNTDRDIDGLLIKEVLEEKYNKEVHHGRLYPNLDTLMDKGLVEKYQVDRRTNGYRLTDIGRKSINYYNKWTDVEV